jgi:hypothetical protein
MSKAIVKQMALDHNLSKHIMQPFVSETIAFLTFESMMKPFRNTSSTTNMLNIQGWWLHFLKLQVRQPKRLNIQRWHIIRLKMQVRRLNRLKLQVCWRKCIKTQALQLKLIKTRIWQLKRTSSTTSTTNTTITTSATGASNTTSISSTSQTTSTTLLDITSKSDAAQVVHQSHKLRTRLGVWVPHKVFEKEDSANRIRGVV